MTTLRDDLISMKVYHEQALVIIKKRLQEQEEEPVSTGSPRKGKKPINQNEIRRKLDKNLIKRKKISDKIN